ncbi:hypothetical protein SAMN05446935_2928 [Burkholderia sp. YR290]|nr:hypothetical protein SAMN05446935_2928 [Burkholderia sp. YR290]
MSGINDYLKRMARLTGRKQRPKLTAKAAKLPGEVQAAVDSAVCLSRTPTDKGPRTVLQMFGLGHLIVEQTPDLEARILRAWPELTPAQVARVMRAISSRVAAEIARSASMLPSDAVPFKDRY